MKRLGLASYWEIRTSVEKYIEGRASRTQQYFLMAKSTWGLPQRLLAVFASSHFKGSRSEHHTTFMDPKSRWWYLKVQSSHYRLRVQEMIRLHSLSHFRRPTPAINCRHDLQSAAIPPEGRDIFLLDLALRYARYSPSLLRLLSSPVGGIAEARGEPGGWNKVSDNFSTERVNLMLV